MPRSSARPSNEEEQHLFAAIKAKLKSDPKWYSTRLAKIKGVTEETTTGVKRLYQMAKDGKLAFPAFNVNDSVTKSKFDNLYGCRESLVDAIKRATDVMIAGKIAVVAVTAMSEKALRRRCGRCRRRSGSPRSIRFARCRPRWKAIAWSPWIMPPTRATSSSRATGNFHVITHEHMKRMKDQAIVCNIGHFDSEIEVAALRQYTWDNIKPQVDHVVFPDGKRIILLAEGRLVNLGCGTGHPVLRHELLVREPGARADRALYADREVPDRAFMCCRSISMRRWRGCSSRSSVRSSPS